MDQDAFSQYVTDRYEDQIGWYDRKAARDQTIYRWMQWTLIVLAAITPILIEFKPPPLGAGWIQWATLTSAVVAILTAGLKTFKYQENWINYRTTCEALRKERHFYDAGLGDYRTADDRESLFVERVESLISREATMWVTMHKAETKSEKAGTQAAG
jgi:hypothetical protein